MSNRHNRNIRSNHYTIAQNSNEDITKIKFGSNPDFSLKLEAMCKSLKNHISESWSDIRKKEERIKLLKRVHKKHL